MTTPDIVQDLQAREGVEGRTGSLRTRLILTNVLITALAVAALGYYVFYRTQQSTTTLADQLDASLVQQAETGLAAQSDQQVSDLNSFFQLMRQDITDAGASTGQLLSKPAELSVGTYWDASTAVTQLATGSWDNPSTEDAASVFIPARPELDPSLIAQLNTLKYLDFVVPGKLAANPDAVAVYFGGPSGETLYYPNIDLANVVPPDFDVTQRPWYLEAAPPQNPDGGAVWSEPYLDAALNGLVVTTSVPVTDASGRFRGVIAMDVQLNRISSVVSNIHAGASGYAFVVDSNKRLIALPGAGYSDLGLQPQVAPLGEKLDLPAIAGTLPDSIRVLVEKMAGGQSGLETINVGGVDRYAVYRQIPEIGYSLAIMVPTNELMVGAATARSRVMTDSTNITQISLVLVLVILVFASLASVILGNTLTEPLNSLTQAAREITAGNLTARARIRSRDEMGILAGALDTMTGNLRGMVQSLEQRVRDRTQALAVASEDANRRAAQFEAVTRVTRAISSTRNVSELMPLVSSVISEAFDYYHVGIFLNDEATGNAYLIAANSEGGHRMLGRHHSLRIGEQGIVGYVAARGEPRVARSVGEDIVFFNNPDLPSTRSEAALPLRIEDRIIGVLDVQSTREDAFLAEDLKVLGVLADQVSLAIENTRLFEATQRSLTETETLYRQYVREAWRRFQPDESVTGYRFTARGTTPLRSSVVTGAHEVAAPDPVYKVPIKLRGESIGDLVIDRAPDGGLTQDQLDIIQAVAERVALSVENARLFDETSRRAARERLVTEITSKIRSLSDPEAMMSMALEELKTALGASQVQIVPQVVGENTQDQTARKTLAFASGLNPNAAGKRSPMSYVITVSNEKGGVAKTTTTISLGAVLAELGHKVLVMDLDPQANLTLALGIEPGSASVTSSHILIESASLNDARMSTDIPNLDLVPSHSSIETAEQYLPVRAHYTLGIRRALEAAAPLTYDYVILDCPPFLGAITINALSAADLLIIPTQAEYFSAYALRSMMSLIRRVRQESNATLGYRILVTMLDRRNRTHRSIQEQLQNTFGDGLFRTVIEIDTKLRESPIAGLPITLYRPGARSAMQYRELAQELIEYVKDKTQQTA